MLAVERVSKSFVGARSRVVLHDVSLQLAAGEYIAVMGESGAGKSTLLNLIAGLDVPDSGRIVVAGQDMAALDDAGRTRLRRARMGFIFQAFHLLPHLSVARNVGLPLALNGAESTAIAARVEEMLAAVGMLDRQDDSPNQLSGGEMQRVAIARALAHRPSLVLATSRPAISTPIPQLKCSRCCARSSNATTPQEFSSRTPTSQLPPRSASSV
jgi:putative ABC transport system ATP-binding protein